jgi:2-oxo-4-hydroxy-4-carboxy-5-ureidoimidazoline decarboxylase
MPNESPLNTLNRTGRAAFVAALGGIFEHAPWVAEGAFEHRPFADTTALHHAMVAVIEAASESRRLELIRNHPDLAGRAAVAGNLTEASRDEQAGAGLDRLSPEEFARFQRLNAAYRDRFGFPYILSVAGHDKHSILRDFEARLDNDPASERRRALDEIARIGRLRLGALLTVG